MEPRPLATWAAIWALVVTVFGVGFGVVKGVGLGGAAVNWYLVVSSVLFVPALLWTVYRLRADARARRQLAPPGATTEACSRCGELVPEWFLEKFPVDGIFAAPRGAATESICRQCTEGWPYPAERESEDEYVERLKEWRAKRKKLAEQEALDREMAP